MDNKCIFCGAVPGLLNKKKLYCGNTNQVLCKDCYPKYKNLSAVERAEAALSSGRAEDADELRSYLENIHQARQEDEESRKAYKEKRFTGMNCIRCGGQMLDYGEATFKLGEETYFFSDLNRLMSGSVTMNIFRCEACGKVEFFAFDDGEFAGQLAE